MLLTMLFFLSVSTVDASCINKELKIDEGCRCTKSSCDKLYDDDYLKLLDSTNKKFGNKFKPIIDSTKHTAVVYGKISRGEKVTAEDGKLLDKERVALNRYNKKQLEELNKVLKSNRMQPFNMKTEVAKYEKSFWSGFPASIRQKFQTGNTRGSVPIASTKKIKIDSDNGASQEEVIIEDIGVIEEDNAAAITADVTNAEAVSEQGTQEVRYKVESDINKNSSQNIFGIISNRYQQATSRGVIQGLEPEPEHLQKLRQEIKDDLIKQAKKI
jgi:hypothetical protein